MTQPPWTSLRVTLYVAIEDHKMLADALLLLAFDTQTCSYAGK